MPESVYTAGEAAALLGVHVNTVRNLAGAWAEFLTPGASPPPGTARRFTGQDLAVLQIIMEAKRDGLPRAAIAAKLQAAPTLPTLPYIDGGAVAADPPAPLQAATTAQSGGDLAAVVALLADTLRTRDQVLVARIEAAERRGAGLLLAVALLVVIAFCLGGLGVLLVLRVAGVV